MRTTGAGWLVFTAAAIGCPMVVAADGAAALSTSRDELVHGWDLNKDGTIDEAEAEVARAKMRRMKLELLQKSATEKSLAPGGGEQKDVAPHKPEGDPLGNAFRPSDPTVTPSGTPPLITPPSSAAASTKDGGNRNAGREPPNRKGDLNAGRPKPLQLSGGHAAGTVISGGQAAGGRVSGGQAAGGVVTGGVRAGGPALRPGYGANGPKVDLNAGRLPAGLPPAQGMRPQVGSAPFRTGFSGNGQARAGDRVTQPPRPPLMPSSPTHTSAEDIGLR